MKTLEELQDDLRWLRKNLGDSPFGIDLVLPKSAPPSRSPEQFIAEIPASHTDFARRIRDKYDVPAPKGAVALHRWGGLTQELGRAQIELLLEERVPVIATGLGSPDFLIDAAHARGLMVWGLIGQPRQAALQIQRGVDAVVAQGYDAAGHTGAMGTFSIVPAVVDIAGNTPVIAAGGVTTGRHLAAALCLGASGVWPGTLWLASRESDVDPLVKERILAASGDDTTRTACISGKTMRVLRCPWTEEWDGPDAPALLETPYQMLLSADYLQAANDHRRADLMTEAAGQGVGFVRDTRGTGEILRGMVEEARGILLALTGTAGPV